MYHYIVDVFNGLRGDGDDAAGHSALSSESARSAQRKEEERRHRLRANRRRAYLDFVHHTPLGQALASSLPRPESSTRTCVFNTNSGAVRTSRNAQEGVPTATLAALSVSQTPSTGKQETPAIDTALESALFTALSPLLSRETTIVARRVLELLGRSHEASSAPLQQLPPSPLSSSTNSASARESSSSLNSSASARQRLPFLFVTLLLDRWRRCLMEVMLLVSTDALSLRTHGALRRLSDVLAAMLAVTEAHKEEVRAYLNECEDVTRHCCEETLRCLWHLIRVQATRDVFLQQETFAMQESRRGRDTTPRGIDDGQVGTAEPESSFSAPRASAVQVQVWRLLSLVLYWMHFVLSAPLPHFHVVQVFFTTSAASPQSSPSVATKSFNSPSTAAGGLQDAGAFPHSQQERCRCTGLSNSALLRHTYAAPGDGPARPVGRSLPLALMTSPVVRESLLALLLIASKGVISGCVSGHGTEAPLPYKKYAGVEVDNDPGFVVVLVCRLLHYMFVVGSRASPPPTTGAAAAEQVRVAVNPLLASLSILLARLIAEDNAIRSSVGVPLRGRASSDPAGQSQYCDPVADHSPPLLSSHATASAPSSPHGRFSTRRTSTQAVSPVPFIRHVRLLGQLACGILLLTTLLQCSAQQVLDTMDHSFFFDALVTTLQVVGRRFHDRHLGLSLELTESASASAAQVWGSWVCAVDSVAATTTPSGLPRWKERVTAAKAQLNVALTGHIDGPMAVLAAVPVVDEFLHAYLGLLSASRLLRAASMLPPNAGPTPFSAPRQRIGDGGVSSAYNSRVDGRAMETLDQLERTVVKTFSTAYDAADGMHGAVMGTRSRRMSMQLGSSGDVSESPPPRSQDEQQEEAYAEGTGLASATAGPFPPTSCLYNLLLKHALWCLRMAEKVRDHQQQQQQGLVLPPAISSGSSLPPSVTATSKVSAHGSPTFGVLPPNAPLLLSQPATAPGSATVSPTPGPRNAPFSPPGLLSGVSGGTETDPFFLFLVRHGLFHILLQDAPYAPAFMVEEVREEVNTREMEKKATLRRVSGSVKGTHFRWQRSFVTLFLLARCLQLQPMKGKATAVEADAAEKLESDPPSLPIPLSEELEETGNRLDTSTGSEVLAYETVDALLDVLRPASYASLSSPPPCAVETEFTSARSNARNCLARRRSQWHNAILALLMAALGAAADVGSGEAGFTPVPPSPGSGSSPDQWLGANVPPLAAAASAVSAALLRGGGVEYLLQASITAAAAPTPLLAEVAYPWTLTVLRGIAQHPVARLYISTNCAKPLLSRVLWSPLLRAEGQTLLTMLLCQPLSDVFAAVTVTVTDSRDMATSALGTDRVSLSSLGAGFDASSFAAAAGGQQVLPRHCRKLCEAVWRVMSDCVNGPAVTSSSPAEVLEMTVSTPTPSTVPSAGSVDETERETVLQFVLASVATALRVLGGEGQPAMERSEELLPLRTLQKGLYEASREGGVHVYMLLLHRLAQSWRSENSSPVSSAPPAASHSAATVPAVTRNTEPSQASVLLSASEEFPAELAQRAREPLASSARRTVTLITKVLAGLLRANPMQRDVLYHGTIDPDALVECISNAWGPTRSLPHCSPSTRPNRTSACASVGRGDECIGASEGGSESELMRLFCYLAYESIDAVDAFFNRQLERDTSRAQTPLPTCGWALQSPMVLSAVLRRFCRGPLTAGDQQALRRILSILTFTVESCQTSLYLAASTGLQEVLVQLLSVVAQLRPTSAASCPAHASASVSSIFYPSPLRLDALLVRLLVVLTRCHINVRQLKQMLSLVTHARNTRERRALVPLVVQLLSAAAQPPLLVPLGQVHRRLPSHFMALHRCSGPAGFRAALPEFPLEGYSVALHVRWDGDVHAEGDGPSTASSTTAATAAAWRSLSPAANYTCSCACIFSLRTADRLTVLALLVERESGRLFVQYCNLQQQEMRVYVPTLLPSQEWTQIILSHRPAAFLTAAAGGQLQLSVNTREVVTIPQVAYPLMSRGHLYVGCLGHEVDRLSVAHTFYGQVATAYFFPYALPERDREVVQAAAGLAEVAPWMTSAASATNGATPPLRPTSTSALGGRLPGVAVRGGNAADIGVEQWLADRASLCVDTRLSDRGHLYNLSAVLRGRTGRESRLLTFEGTLVCSTQRVMESMGLLGALPSVVMPLCTLLVNPSLPISSRGMVAATYIGRDGSTVPMWAMTPTDQVRDVYPMTMNTESNQNSSSSPPQVVDATNAAVLWVLELLPALASNEAIRTEMAESGLFVFLGQVLQLLGPSLQVVVPPALMQLLESLATFPRLLEDALTNLFLSSDVIHAAPRAVQLAWVNTERAFLEAHPDALPCLRALGTSMFVAAEVLRVTSEENNERALEERVMGLEAGAPSSASSTASPLPACSLEELASQWMTYFESLIVTPATMSEVQSLQFLVENLRWTCGKESVQLHLLRHVRQLIVSSSAHYFVQLLGRKNYVVSLIPYMTESCSEDVRVEAVLQLLWMVFRSKRTQEIMNPVLLSSREAVVHVAEEVSLSWLKDVLEKFPVTHRVHLALRCGLIGQFDVAMVPTEYTPLDASHGLKFAAVLLPMLMLMKQSEDATLKVHVLRDIAVLLRSDPQAWRRIITVRGWYVSLIGLFASPCGAVNHAAPKSDAARSTKAKSTPAPQVELAPHLQDSGAAFRTTSMILSYTLFQVLLHESYGATEMALAAVYLREQRLHRLLNHVLCAITDRYRSRLLAQRGERLKVTEITESEELEEVCGDAFTVAAAAAAPPPNTSPPPSAAFLGLGSAVAVLNLSYFIRAVEIVLFYAAPSPRRDLPLSSSAASTNGSTNAGTPHIGTPTTRGLPSGAPGSGSEDSTPLPVRSSRTGYSEWAELTLLPMEGGGGGENNISPSRTPSQQVREDVYFAAEDDDPHGDVRRAVLRHPDGRWLHLPLAVKCAELLCAHSALLHLGSHGGAAGNTSVSAGGASAVQGDGLLSAMMGAAGASGSASSGTFSFTGYSGSGGPSLLKGGMLRLFGRLFHAVCRMTLNSRASLESVLSLVDAFVRNVDRSHRSSGFLLLKRTTSAEEAREHTPIATAMTVVYSLHELLLRRLDAGECGPCLTHVDANAALVERLKAVMEAFRVPFEQLPTFAAEAGKANNVVASPSSSHAQRTRSSVNSRLSISRSSSQEDFKGEMFAAGVSTLQWLCDRASPIKQAAEAFAEVASRPDYNSFVARCLLAVEREQSTDKAIELELMQEQRLLLRRLQDLFAENRLSRQLVLNNIKSMRGTVSAGSEAGGPGNMDEMASTTRSVTTLTDSADNSFTSFFLPSAARKVMAAARAATWARFTSALRGTVWNLDAAGLQQKQQQQQRHLTSQVKYVKVSAQEQQALVHRKLIFDRDGTNYSGAAISTYSAPTSPRSGELSVTPAISAGGDTTLDEDAFDSDLSFSGTGSTSHPSRLRLRGGEAVLLQMPEDEDAAAEEEEELWVNLEEDMASIAASLSEYTRRDTATAAPSTDENRSTSPGVLGDNTAAAAAVPSVLSLPCEVPYMMHCWSASFTVRGSEVFVLMDDENKAYNQVVSVAAKPYILRPRTFSFHLTHVTQIAPGRRFRMRRTALEVWTRDRRSYFLNFVDTTTMNAALQAIRAGGVPRYPFMASAFLRTATGAVTASLPAILRQAASGGGQHSVYVLQENPRREPMRVRAMALWVNRMLSNFDYLLVLNLLAGRTLNDMTQYPVFPWILADYKSEELDLANVATFRDLSLPMGASGSEDRREMVRERYMEMKDLGDVPSHYFTHYSSAAVTLYFLIRLPPYTTLAILLQGGHFDHADRMFYSMEASYKTVTTSTQDVRELIPELYYMPELCTNANGVDFGRRQDRTPMDGLKLPPWAKEDPFTFTYRMREALESSYVSAHLHEWIDLIFGYKQRGKDAIEALNVFNWHSYEELDRNRAAGGVNQQLLIDSLDNIGQTPIQLFRRPHQPRPALEWGDALLLPTQVKVLPLRWGCMRVATAVVMPTDKVLVVTGNGAAASLRMQVSLLRRSAEMPCPSAASTATVAPPSSSSADSFRSGMASPEHRARSPHTRAMRSSVSAPLLQPGGGGGVGGMGGGPATPSSNVGRSTVSNSDTGSFDVSEEYERRIAPIPAGIIPNNSPYADGSCSASSVALLCYDNEVFLVLGGLFDNSVAIRALSGASGDMRLRAHRGRVTLVVRTGDSRYLVTGAEDTTFTVWSCQLRPDRQQLEVELLFTIYGHEDMPSAVDVSSTLDIVASASLDGVLMLHSLSTGSLDRVIRHPHGAAIHRVLLQTNCYVPNIIFHSHQDDQIHQYSLNGAPLRTFAAPGRVTAWAVTSSQHFLLAYQPHPYLHSNQAVRNRGTGRETGERRSSSASSVLSGRPGLSPPSNAPCILYVHSFFLEVVKTVPVPAEHVVSSLSAHPSYPQVVVAGTESGRLLLLRSVAG